MDIIAALKATPERGHKRCGVAKFLDGIPEDTDGRDELVRLVETPHDRSGRSGTRSAQDMAVVLTQLGHETTQNPVHHHRNRACACYR